MSKQTHSSEQMENKLTELKKARDFAKKTQEEAEAILSMDIDDYFFFVLRIAKDSENPTDEEKFKALADYQAFKNDPDSKIMAELEQFRRERKKDSTE